MSSPATSSTRGHRDFFGSVIGILVFLGGVALLLEVFKLAYEMFNVPPAKALNISSGTKLDLNVAGSLFVGIMLRVILLLVMALVGSWIANRGISLYTHSRGIRFRVEEP